MRKKPWTKKEIEQLPGGKIPGDEWETPQWLFNKLNEEFNFEDDICCTEENRKCGPAMYYEDMTSIWGGGGGYLRCPWSHADSVFCNPPYSNILEFIKEIVNLCIDDMQWYLRKQNHKGITVVLLLPCEFSATGRGKKLGWSSYIWNHKAQRKRRWVKEIRFLPKRVRFEYKGRPGPHSDPRGSMIVVMGVK